jgi:hypothetical protein
MLRYDVAVIGAGPYGLAAAAHLRQIRGLDTVVFGDPMWFWKARMPAGMLLRSSWSASHIGDPHDALTLDAYKLASNNHLAAPVSLSRFVDYGLWFQRAVVPDLDRRKITVVKSAKGGFQLTAEDGELFHARRVVVAAGISSFAVRPVEFVQIPCYLASHSSDHPDLSVFAGKTVAVVGGGQSALESAALLNEAGAQVELIIRRPKVHWLGWKDRLQTLGPVSRLLFSPHDVGPAVLSRVVAVPELMNKLPRRLQDRLRTFCIRPAGACWLPARLKNVTFTTGTSVSSAVPTGDRVRLLLSDRTERIVDHVLLGTGYRVNAARYNFLAPNFIGALEIINGFPKLGPGLESTVPGLHFLGAPAAWSCGPLLYFVSGTKFAAQTLASHIASRKRVAG